MPPRNKDNLLQANVSGIGNRARFFVGESRSFPDSPLEFKEISSFDKVDTYNYIDKPVPTGNV